MPATSEAWKHSVLIRSRRTTVGCRLAILDGSRHPINLKDIAGYALHHAQTVDEGEAIGAAANCIARTLEPQVAFRNLFDGIATRAGGPRFWRDNLVQTCSIAPGR